MDKWQDILELIKEESNINILQDDLGMEDSFTLLLTIDPAQTLLLTIDPAQQKELEELLEKYPKADNFKANYEAFGVKRYMVKGTSVQYQPERNYWFVQVFEKESKTESDSNVYLSFHPFGKNIDFILNSMLIQL